MPDKSYQNSDQNRRLEKLETHIEIINKELGNIRSDLAMVKSDVSWLKRFFWIIATSSIAGLVASVLNLMLK